MRRRLALVLCLILIAVHGTGTHAHLLLSNHGDADFSGAAIAIANDQAPDHMVAHSQHGDIDLDLPADRTNDLPSLQPPVAMLALIVSDVSLRLPRVLALAWQPPQRPPPRQAWRYFTPLSHAPPIGA